ncbi:MAG TPA: hypothetical protein VFA26_21735, partial [Gemmataceae bacterium]|nr:hypothetical protein [Gemmataceae bacterium]
MHRRDFLDARQLAQAAGHLLGAADAPGDGVTLLRLARRCMATSFEVVVPYGTPDAADVAEAAFDLLDRLEAQL